MSSYQFYIPFFEVNQISHREYKPIVKQASLTANTTITTIRGQASTTKLVYSQSNLYNAIQHIKQLSSNVESENVRPKYTDSRKPRTIFTSEQIKTLEFHFKQNMYLSREKQDMISLSKKQDCL